MRTANPCTNRAVLYSNGVRRLTTAAAEQRRMKFKTNPFHWFTAVAEEKVLLVRLLDGKPFYGIKYPAINHCPEIKLQFLVEIPRFEVISSQSITYHI